MPPKAGVSSVPPVLVKTQKRLHTYYHILSVTRTSDQILPPVNSGRARAKVATTRVQSWSRAVTVTHRLAEFERHFCGQSYCCNENIASDCVCLDVDRFSLNCSPTAETIIFPCPWMRRLIDRLEVIPLLSTSLKE